MLGATDILSWLVGVPCLIVVAAVIFGVLQPPSDFRIVVNARGVRFHGRFPPVHQAEVARFLTEESGVRRAVISGKWTAGRVLRVSVRGLVDPGQEQRIRNFLKMTLRG